MAHFEGYLRVNLKGYPNCDQAVKDAKIALEQYKTLRPTVQHYVYPDGQSKDLVCLDGTIPVMYRGATYNIPIAIWLQDRHPFIPPLAFVKPTAEMNIKPGKHVDNNGRIYLPFLTDWKHPQSDLYGLIQVLCLIFAEQPPVFARTRPAPPVTSGYPPPRQPYPGYPQSSGTPPYHGHVQMPVPGSMPQGARPHNPPYPNASQQRPGPVYPQQQQVRFPTPAIPPYPSTTNYLPVTTTQTTPVAMAGLTRNVQSFKIPDETMNESIKCAVEDKIRRRLNEVFAQAQTEMDSMKRTENDLKEGQRKLDSMIQQIEMEEAEVKKDISVLTQKNKEMEELVSTLEQQSNMNIDEAVVPRAPLYSQILELYAEENSLDDTMYYLGEALRREKIDLDVFLKNVRSLSRRQFMTRALLQKARKTAGLSEL